MILLICARWRKLSPFQFHPVLFEPRLEQPVKSTTKLQRACHCTHLAKIQEMKSISEPPLPPAIHTFLQHLSADDFRKEGCVRWSLLTSSKLHCYGLDSFLQLIHGPMANGLFVNPVLLLPYHSFPVRDLSCWTCLVKRTGFWPVTKCLKTISLLAWIPLIDDHLHGHATSPNTDFAFCFVGSCLQPSVTALPVYLQRGRRVLPWWGRALCFRPFFYPL